MVHLQPGHHITPELIADLARLDALKAQVSHLQNLLETILAVNLRQRFGAVPTTVTTAPY